MSSFKNSSGYNPDFDIQASSDVKQFNFKDDLQYGQIGEALVATMLDALVNSSFEIKTDRYRNY
jgi:predicted lipoprotein